MVLQKLILLLALAWLLLVTAAAAGGRGLPPPAVWYSASRALEARLAGGLLAIGGGGGLVECWNALLRLKSCTNEIVLFLLDGEAPVGPRCCGAVQVLTQRCWPVMLASVGLTVHDADVLQGYCNGEAAAAAVPPPPPPETDAGAPTPAAPLA